MKTSMCLSVGFVARFFFSLRSEKIQNFSVTVDFEGEDGQLEFSGFNFSYGF